MGKLYPREGSPYWWARWVDAGGVPQRKSTRSRDRKVATLFLSAREAEVIRASAGYVTARSIALSRATAEFLAERQPPIWSRSWLATVVGWMPRILDSLGGPDVVLAAVTRADVERARVAWLAGSDEYRKIAPSTVNRLMAIGSGLWRWAIDRGYATDNPFARHPRFAENKREVEIPAEKVIDAWLAAIRSPLIRRAATVEVDTALRRSELERAHVGDLRGDVLSVVSSYARGHTKTKAPRLVPLTPRALAALRAQIGKRKEGPIFGPLPAYRRELVRAAKAAGIDRLRWHDLRHLALSRLAGRGATGIALRSIAGWHSSAMEARYVHPTLAAARAAVDALGACAPSVRRVRSKSSKSKHARDTRPAPSPRNH